MIIIYIFSFYLFLYLTNLFIDFLKKTTFTHARLFCLYCCYFTKKKKLWILYYSFSKPCHHNHSNKMKSQKKKERNGSKSTNSNTKTLPFEPLKSFSSFFWEVHERIWSDLMKAWNAVISGQNLWVHVQGAQFSKNLSGKWIKWPKDQ